ncbi:uncharacterized protein LOC113561895 [Ooceraea biroi]|uniref:uncharacterized protein LOC113561895 n=1 Tax=Ooceraea biroi TaxID=2015173 RepID=UPI000F099A31|nr:uncharacterized protein LOC113561895 [Ooceraea biroi]
MKTLVFVACLLAVAYASDPEKVKAFYESYAKCSEELGVAAGTMDAKAIKCVGEKAGLYDEQGVLLKEKCLEYIDGLASDTKKDQAKELVSNCLEKEWQGSASNNDKAIAAIQCTLQQNIMDLFDKPQ